MSKMCKHGHESSTLAGGRYADGGCKECKKAAGAKWRAENPEREKARRAKRPAENPEQEMFRQAKKRARKAGAEFTITLANVVIPERCPWLGILLARGKGGAKDNSPSLDRIVPEIGYVKGNVIVISHLANRIKNSATPEQLARVLAGLRSVYPQWLLID